MEISFKTKLLSNTFTAGCRPRLIHCRLGEDLPELVLMGEQSPRRLQNVQPQLLATQQVDINLVRCWRDTHTHTHTHTHTQFIHLAVPTPITHIIYRWGRVNARTRTHTHIHTLNEILTLHWWGELETKRVRERL